MNLFAFELNRAAASGSHNRTKSARNFAFWRKSSVLARFPQPAQPNARWSCHRWGREGGERLRIGLACLLALVACSTWAESVNLAWNPSTSTGVTGYKIYYGLASRVYTQTLTAGNTTAATVSGLVAGTTVYFAATAYTASGLESAYSTEISYLVPSGRPAGSLTIPADTGQLTAPFVALLGIVSQDLETPLSTSGRAVYDFTIVNPGPYVVSGLINAPDGGANSAFVNIDAEPTDPLMVWDMPITTGFQNVIATWRDGAAQHIFNLSAGNHQLVVRGREAGVQFQTFTITPAYARLSIAVSPSKQVTLTGMGRIGQAYNLLSSSNLSTWSALANFTVDDTGAFVRPDPTSATLPARFYRLLPVGATNSEADVVGYYNVAAPANQRIMVGNQLHTTNDTLAGVIPTTAPGASFSKYVNGFSVYTFDDLALAWTGNPSLAPGDGGFFRSPVNTTLTFIGAVPQGTLTNTLPTGVKSLRTSIVPQAGRLSTDLKLPGQPSDNLYQYRNGYVVFTFDDLDRVWSPYEPTNRMGEAFFYLKAAGNTSNLWVRSFSVQ